MTILGCRRVNAQFLGSMSSNIPTGSYIGITIYFNIVFHSFDICQHLFHGGFLITFFKVNIWLCLRRTIFYIHISICSQIIFMKFPWIFYSVRMQICFNSIPLFRILLKYIKSVTWWPFQWYKYLLEDRKEVQSYSVILIALSQIPLMFITIKFVCKKEWVSETKRQMGCETN